MANVDSLNFELILKDEKFNEQIQKDLENAKQLNTQLTNLLEVKAKVAKAQKQVTQAARDDLQATKNANKAKEEQARHESAMARAAESRRRAVEQTAIVEDRRASQARVNADKEKKAALDVEAAEARKARAMGKSTKHMQVQSSLLSQMTGLLTTYFSITGGIRLVKDLAAITGEFEMQRRTLQAILGDVEGANAVFDNLKNLAVESPFQFKDLTSYAKQLSAFSIPMNELYDTTKMLADVSAGLGVDMGRIILAYGQIRSASFLRGQEVRQLTEAGIPILTELAKQFEQMEGRLISAGEVFDRISKRQVSFEMVAKVFKDMTSEGGKFYDMQAVQAQTLTGKISNLKDAYQIMMNEIGERNSDTMKGAVDKVRELMLNYEKLVPVIKGLIITFGVYKGVMAAVAAIQATVAMSLGNWVALIGSAITGLVYAFKSAREESQRFEKELNSLIEGKANDAQQMVDKFEALKERLLGCKEGTQDYRDAMSQLNQQYGEYLPQLLTEKDTLDEIQSKIVGVTNAIYARAKAYAYEAVAKKVDEEYLGEDYNDSISVITDAFKNKSFGKEVGREFLRQFREEVNKNTGDSARVLMDRILENMHLPKDLLMPIGAYTNQNLQALQRIAEAMRAAKKAQEEWNNTLDVSFGPAMGRTIEQMQALEAIETKYKNAISEASAEVKQSAEAFNAFKIEKRKEELKELIDLYKSWGDAKMAKQLQNELDTLTKGFTGWRKIVNDIADKSGLRGFSVIESDQYLDYVDKLRKTYKDLPQMIADTEKSVKGENKQYKAQKKLIEDIAKALGIALDTKSLAGKKGGSSSGKSPEQTALEMEINNLKDLYTAYEKLKNAGVDSDKIKETLKGMWPDYEDTINTNTFVTALLQYADALEVFDKKAANAVREWLKKDAISILLGDMEKDKRAQKAKDWLDGFFDSGVALEGEGTFFDVQKIVKSYKDQLKEIGDKFKDARTKWKEEYEKSDGRITKEEYENGLFNLNFQESISKGNALANATNKLRKEAKGFVDEWAKANDVDLTNLTDKTTEQLDALSQSLEKFLNDGLPEEYKLMLKDLMGGSDALSNAIKVIVRDYLNKVKEGKGTNKEKDFKQMAKDILTVAKAVVELSGAVADYARASGNLGLERTANAIGGMGNVVKDIAQGAKNGGWAGAIAAGISSIGQAALEAATEAEELRNEIRMTAIEAESMRFSDNLTRGIDSLFGEDTLKKIRNATLGLNKFNEALSPNRTFSFTTGFLGMGKQTKEIGDAMNELGYDLTDMYGNLNADGLQAILDTYKNLTEADKAWITEAIKDSQSYAEAMEQLRDVVSGIFGDLSNTIVDDMVEAFNATGDAANGLANIFDNMSQSLLKSVLNTIVLEEVLNKYEDDLLGIFRDYGNDQDYAKMMSEINGIMGSINKDLESTSTVANAILNAAQDMGWNTGESSSQNLANGIKTITEETGNLLASYINAIRADVSSLRVISVANSGYLQQILGLLPASPTLADYLNQINANTYDIKVATEDILSDLRSVMTSASGEMAIRAAVQ